MDETPVPGWYPDPLDAARVRYWDGVAWTHWERVRGSGPVPHPVAVTAAPAAPPHYVPDATPSGWLIATSPGWYGATFVFLMGFVGVTPLASSAIVGALAVTAVALVVLAFRDRTTLARRGIVRPASPLWSLATPIAYLVARHRAVRKNGPTRDLLLPTFLLLGVPVATLVTYAFL